MLVISLLLTGVGAIEVIVIHSKKITSTQVSRMKNSFDNLL